MKKSFENPYKMNLQLHAGEGNPDSADGAENNSSDSGTDNPSVEDLQAQLATERANAARYKASLDKTLQEKKKAEQQYRSTLSAQEQADIAAKEANEARDRELNSLRQELQIIKATKSFMGLRMDEKTAGECAKAFAEGASDKVFEALSKHVDALVKAAKEEGRMELLKERPDINAGSGSSDDKMALGKEKAKASAARLQHANTDILKHYT